MRGTNCSWIEFVRVLENEAEIEVVRVSGETQRGRRKAEKARRGCTVVSCLCSARGNKVSCDHRAAAQSHL